MPSKVIHLYIANALHLGIFLSMKLSYPNAKAANWKTKSQSKKAFLRGFSMPTVDCSMVFLPSFIAGPGVPKLPSQRAT